MHKQYEIKNLTTNTTEKPWAENEQMLMSLYKSVGEEIQIIRVLQEGKDEVVYKPQPMKNLELPPEQNPVDVLSGGIEQVSETRQPTLPKHFEPVQPDQFFEVDGKQLKLSNGILYHKIWMDVDDMNDYRIVSQKTEKIITNEFKTLQQLKWSPADGVGYSNV